MTQHGHADPVCRSFYHLSRTILPEVAGLSSSRMKGSCQVKENHMNAALSWDKALVNSNDLLSFSPNPCMRLRTLSPR